MIMGTFAKRLEGHFVACAAAASAVVAGTAQKSEASIVYSGVQNIPIPLTVFGVYLNLQTGANGASPAAAPGWDVNPFGSTILSFGANEAFNGYLGFPNQVVNVLPGTQVTNWSYTVGQPVYHNLNASTNLFGVKFTGGDGMTHYGWIRVQLGSSLTTLPRNIVDWAYESVATLGIPAGAVPTPGSLALLALGAAGLAGRRRR